MRDVHWHPYLRCLEMGADPFNIKGDYGNWCCSSRSFAPRNNLKNQHYNQSRWIMTMITIMTRTRGEVVRECSFDGCPFACQCAGQWVGQRLWLCPFTSRRCDVRHWPAGSLSTRRSRLFPARHCILRPEVAIFIQGAHCKSITQASRQTKRAQLLRILLPSMVTTSLSIFCWRPESWTRKADRHGTWDRGKVKKAFTASNPGSDQRWMPDMHIYVQVAVNAAAQCHTCFSDGRSLVWI